MRDELEREQKQQQHQQKPQSPKKTRWRTQTSGAGVRVCGWRGRLRVAGREVLVPLVVAADEVDEMTRGEAVDDG